MRLVLRNGKWYDKETGKEDKSKAKKYVPGAFPSFHVEAGYDQTVSPIDGHVFKSKRDHSEYMKRNNLVVKEDTKADRDRREKVFNQKEA